MLSTDKKPPSTWEGRDGGRRSQPQYIADQGDRSRICRDLRGLSVDVGKMIAREHRRPGRPPAHDAEYLITAAFYALEVDQGETGPQRSKMIAETLGRILKRFQGRPL